MGSEGRATASLELFLGASFDPEGVTVKKTGLGEGTERSGQKSRGGGGRPCN